MNKIKIGIVGYGNIGRGVEQSIKRNDDMELTAVFTRRDPATVSIQTESAAVKHFDEMVSMKDEIDVMILCGGSATDLPVIRRKLLLLLIRLTVLIPTQRFLNILLLWIMLQKKEIKSVLFLSAGILECFL